MSQLRQAPPRIREIRSSGALAQLDDAGSRALRRQREPLRRAGREHRGYRGRMGSPVPGRGAQDVHRGEHDPLLRCRTRSGSRTRTATCGRSSSSRRTPRRCDEYGQDRRCLLCAGGSGPSRQASATREEERMLLETAHRRGPRHGPAASRPSSGRASWASSFAGGNRRDRAPGQHCWRPARVFVALILTVRPDLWRPLRQPGGDARRTPPRAVFPGARCPVT